MMFDNRIIICISFYLMSVFILPKSISNTIDKAVGPEKNSDIFLTKYKNLFNSVPTNDTEMTNICSTIRNDVVHADDIRITVDIIKTCIKKLKMHKDDGKHGFNSDHLIHVQIVCLSFSASCLILC